MKQKNNLTANPIKIIVWRNIHKTQKALTRHFAGSSNSFFFRFDDLVMKDNSKQIYLFVWNHIVWWFLTREFRSNYKSLTIDQIFIIPINMFGEVHSIAHMSFKIKISIQIYIYGYNIVEKRISYNRVYKNSLIYWRNMNNDFLQIKLVIMHVSWIVFYFCKFIMGWLVCEMELIG